MTDDEDGKACVSLTHHGLHQIRSLADTLNSLSPEEPQGRLKEVLIIFKKEGLLQEKGKVSMKNLGNLCEKSGYSIRVSNLRSLVSTGFARQFFVFDRERDTVQLSPIGIEMAQTLT